MEIIKRDEHFTVDIEMSEAEVQTLVALFLDYCNVVQRPPEKLMGLRGDMYKKFTEVLETNP